MLVLALLVIQTMGAPQTSPNAYNYCASYAQQQTGYRGAPMPPQNQHAPLAGAAGGALAGSLIGGMGGGNSGRGAAIGAGFGLVAGAARRNQAEQKMQTQENNFYNVLNACLASRH